MIKRLKNLLLSFVPDNSYKLVLLFAMMLSLGSFFYLYSNNLVLSIEDGRAHLNIARRVIDSQTPGLTQLGGIWLPLPHLFMLPFIWNDFLWHSGIAGVIPSAFFFIISAVFLFNFLVDFYKSKIAGIIGIFVYMTNPNLLFIQATPMTEAISISFFILSISFFWKWLSTNKFPYLIITAVAVSLGTLTRYDGWILPIVICLGVIVFGLIKQWKIARIEGRIILFAIPAFLGIFFWIVYNTLIFGNPTNFVTGEGSAAWFAQYEAGRDTLPTKGSIITASQVYGGNILDTIGIVISAISVIGFLYLLYSLKRDKFKYEKLFLLILLLSPILFNIYSLYSGKSVMWSQWVYPHKVYNVRYTLQALPILAILIAGLTKIKPLIIAPILIIFIVLQLALFKANGESILLKDITQTKGSPREKVGKWLKEHPTNGLTLISAGANEVAIFDSGMPIKQVVYEGNKPTWDNSLKKPYPYISRIVMGSVIGAQTDKVYTALNGKKALAENYMLRYAENNYYVYDRIDSYDRNKTRGWTVKSIDTMKTSRDRAKWGIKKVNFIKELEQIKKLGVNYVAIDTPYDEQFYPYLKAWTDEAHRLGLSVWFRGNWSGWEGWNDYPKTLTREQHLNKTKNFIVKHAELFRDGDSLTPCPECEYGGAGNPLETKDIKGFRKFLLDEYSMMNIAFKKINKKVYINWFSMNPDVAREVWNEELINKTGNLITLDYFVRNVEQLKSGLNYFNEKFPEAKILLGEFGAPIKSINGRMSQEQQQVFVNEIFKYVLSRKDIMGINYWVSSEGETALLTNNLEPKKVTYTVKKYFMPTTIKGTVVDVLGDALPEIEVATKDKSNVVMTDNKGNFSFTVIGNAPTVEISDNKYKIVSSYVHENDIPEVEYKFMLEPKYIDLPYRFRLIKNALLKKIQGIQK